MPLTSVPPNLLLRGLITLALLFCAPTHAVQINEIRIDQPGNDNDEYFELIGDANQSLEGFSYLVIGDGSGQSGTIEAVIDLSGQSLDSNGLLVAAEGTFSLAAANLTTTINFENSDNVTHLLIEGFVGSNGDDLDVDDDGTFDSTPWASIADSVALVEDLSSGERVYSNTQVGPAGSFVPGHVYRCGTEFEIGEFDPSAADAADTPTAVNNCPQTPTQISEIRIDQPGSDNDEYFELIGNAGALLDGLTYLVIGDGAGGSGVIESVTDLTGSSFDQNGFFVAAKNTFALANANLTTGLIFENSDNVTHLLVADFTGATADDLDIDNDGLLDVEPWSRIVDSVALQESSDSGERIYSDTVIGPDGSLVPGHIYRCENGYQIGLFDPAEGVDTPGAANNCAVNPSIVEATIPEIQGTGDASPLLGQQVRTTGIVVADFQADDELKGFFLQDAAGDGNTASSDGIFVFDPDGVDVNVGDQLTVVAKVDEFFGMTELDTVSSIQVTGTGTILPTAVTLPETVEGELEAYEGMLVEIIGDITVSQNFFLGRYGQMTLAAANDQGDAGRLYQPTNQFPAGSAQALALAAENTRRTLVLDDGQDVDGRGDNPVPVPYIEGPPPGVIRSGDSVTNLVGVLDFGRISSANPPRNDFRLHPTVKPVFTSTNPRQAVPQSTGGRLVIASYNVLNYFNTIDAGNNRNSCGPNANLGCRGADSQSEFARQQAKIVNTIVAMNADVVGLIEIENNGNGPDSAAQNLVNAVNAVLGAETYAIAKIDDTPLGGDAIAVGIIYKPSTLVSVGTAATLSSGAFDQNLPEGRSRQPLAVSFEEISSGEQFTVVVNHFKSKGSPPSDNTDPNFDQGDGQGNWNLRRTEAANDLVEWLATNPTGINDPDVMIIGDLNAYAKESPILALNDLGYTDLIEAFNGPGQYSFTFDGQAGYLDHALASAELAEQVTAVVEWHINTDEPAVIDYNEDFNPAGYYDEQPFRSSDHDPVLVGVDLLIATQDADNDGVNDDRDLCQNTPEGDQVDRKGCSVRQSIERQCERFLPHHRLRYFRCAVRQIRRGFGRGLISLREARHLYFEVLFTTFYGRRP